MSASTGQTAKSEAAPANHRALPLFFTDEPAAVHPHDLDTVFLSKTVVSLADVFAHTIDGPYDVSSLQAPRLRSAGQRQSEKEAADKQAQMDTTDVWFSTEPAPYTSSSLKRAASSASTRASALRPKAVVRGKDGRWRTVSTDQGADARTSTATASSQPPSKETHGRMLFVPLDTYHFLLTYHDVDLAGQLDRNCDKHTAVTVAERLSADSPGRRPPRSGICVVRRLEGELRGVDTAPSFTTAAPVSTPCPTLSHVVHGLPLDAFDGWVRDYTVYGLRCNEAVLRAAWEDKTCERGWGASPVPMSAMMEMGQSAASARKAVSSDSLCDNPDDVDLAVLHESCSEDAAVDGAAAAAAAKETRARSGEEAVTRASGDAEPAAMVSPSLDRLNCSSTTSSGITAFTPSASIERSGNKNSLGGVEVTTEVAERESGGVPDTISVSQMSTRSQMQQKNVLWNEQRAPAERAAEQLRHRFLVSDSAQHAIWALEVRLPAMEVRALSPAEFYASEIEDGHARGEPEAPIQGENGEEGPMDAPPLELALPRKRSAVTAAQGGIAPSSHRGSATGSYRVHASRFRSPSPTNPSTPSTTGDADDQGNSTHAGGDERRCTTSVRTQSTAVSCSSTQHLGRPASSASPSLAMAEATTTPLIGGGRGFVDGHFSLARFCSPGALCWRIDEEEDDENDNTHHGMVVESEEIHGRRARLSVQHRRDDPIADAARRRHCTVLFISDMGNCAIRYADFGNCLVRTITGVNGVPGYRDGSCMSSMLRGATALAWCSAGLIFTDGANNVVRLVTDICGRRKSREKRDSGEDTPETAADDSSACCATRATASKRRSSRESEVLQESATTTEEPPCVEEKPVDEERRAHPFIAEESQNGALQGMPPPSVWKRKSPAVVVPRVWTLAGCTSKTSIDQSTGGVDANVASYVDCAVPSRARFGYISDMALWTDETGDTQVLLVDQTHHALRILDAHRGVSTYVGPLDYEVMSTVSSSTASTSAANSLPPGLVFPCCLTVGALIKERSPALLSATSTATAAATMITPQPYLYSSSPLLFTASAVTSAVSMLLPISRCSAPTSCNLHENQCRSTSTEAREAEAMCLSNVDNATKLDAIRGALELGVATEGRRVIGEAATPSLKHLVVCWGEDEATDDGAESSHAAPRRSSVASGQQALQYLRMRFPWLLPPSVPLLSSRLVAACTCHVSGKRRGTTAPTTGSKALGLHSQTGSNSHSAHIQEGAHPDGVDGIRRGVTTTVRPLPQQQRLLFQDPTRHSPMATCRYTSATAPAAAAAEEVVAASLNTHSRDVGGDGAAPVDRPEVGGGRSSSSNRSNPYRASSPLSPNDNLNTVEGEEGEQVTPGGDVGGGRRPVAKWLPPPLKSVSRSPSNTRGQQQQQQQEEKSHADLAGSPSKGTAATYAGQFQEWSSEQRQKRLRSTLENSDSTSMLDTSPGGAPPVLDGRRQQMEGDGRHGFSPRGPQSAKCGSLEQTDLLLTPSSSRSPRAHPTSSNKLSSRSSPPLTPRAMVAHQLMQRRRSSRSNTAPHVRSVEREASGFTSGQRTAVVDAHGVRPPPPQTKRKDGSVVGAAPAEPPRVSAVPDRRTVQPCRADAHLHDVYDMAVRRLFRIYDYLAKKVVTTKAEASRNCDNEGSPWATHQPHQVVQYSMSFAAFLRFFVLTGYGDYLSEVAAAAVDAHGKDDVDPRAAARVHSAPSPMSMLCRLTQVQPGGGGDNAPQWRSACRKRGIAHPKPSLPSNVMVVPLATTDLRAIAAVLYACGVRQKGYHTVTQMDFQSFRRVALLLYTWARTARCAETAKRANTTDDVAVECGRGSGHRKTGGQNSAGGGSRRCPTRGGTTVAAFAYVDAVPSLDALSSSEVVAAYTEVYERAVRCIPALAMSYGREATNKGDEDDDGEARAVDRAMERGDEIQYDRQVNAMCAADSVAAPPSEVGAGSRGVDRELVDLDEAATPPLSPIAATAVAGDVSCLAIDGNAVVKSRKYPVMETPSTLGNADDATNLFPTGRLTPCETLALDALLRLLQSNESTFAQLFEAYSVPITVHRSPQYESPLSAAAAASASNTCSVLMCSPEASLVLRDGREAVARRLRRASATFVAPTASGTSSVPVAPPVIAVRDHRTGASAHGMPCTMPGLAKPVAGVDVEHGSAALSGISTTQQDVSWKVRQLCTMSAAESQGIYERKSHDLRVVTFKLFVELWRTLDVFPSLMRKGAMEQAFYDALTTPMLRGSRPPQPGCASGAPIPQGQLQPPLNRPGALAHRHVIELLCAHGGLPFACFVESFVRVALTVFSHEVDRIAYPTATAKTAGLMQWCNKQVTLGLVAKRVQQQHSAVATGRHDSNKRSSSMISMDAAQALFSATPATRTARVAGAFPNQLRLFRLPTAAKTRVSDPMPAQSPSMVNVASRIHRQVSRIDLQTAEKLFPREQRLQWPTGYLPASGVAHLLHPDGVPFHEVLECYMDIKRDGRHELQRDFASDYTLWNRCSLEEFVRRLGSHRRRHFTRLTARDRLVHDASVREVFQLAPYLPPAPPAVMSSLSSRGRATPPSQAPIAAATSTTAADVRERAAYHHFQSYAATQEYAMLPVQGVRSPQQRVRFSVFPQIRNVLHTDFDSMTALRALNLYSEDGIMYTRELVQTIALYVQRRLEEILEAEAVFLRIASKATAPSSVPLPTFASESPVIVFFGNGRLAWMLNESGLFPRTVRAVQLPRQEVQRSRRRTHLLQQQETLENDFAFHKSFTTIFPCETLSVGDALRKYKPAIALVEPHVDRDYISDIRGYYSVREVLLMGPIDSPAMGSFSFPFLTFGVTPGPTTYWVYNDNLQKVKVSARVQMPMDAPYKAQGYERHYVDDISAYLISPNDCSAIGGQFRCLAFRRVRPPVLKHANTAAETTPQSSNEEGDAAATEGGEIVSRSGRGSSESSGMS